ncbi:C40 family peptidase [Roseovarius sp. D22-M7]|uniref:C40 family peptidase n=1 Tax=Roseovarius sp. D22-M7 TaxID=3127116 RepID=UPI003010213E
MRGEPLRADVVIAEARRWIGARWRHQGRGPAGVDCIGLLIVVADGLRVPHHDVQGYDRRATSHRLVEEFAVDLAPVPLPEARPGDILVFAETSYPCHAGFLTARHGVPHLLHAHALRRCVLEEPLVEPWLSRRRAAYRMPGVV